MDDVALLLPPPSRFDHAVALQLPPQGVLPDAERLGGLGAIVPEAVQRREDVPTLDLFERQDLVRR
jgi:hypothetical protein